jgi:hypothetical protein
MTAPINNWIVCVSGYLQRYGDAHQGVPALAHALHTRHGRRCRVEFHPWNSDWSGIAEWIFRTSRNGEPPRIMVVAYSWGVGFGAVRLLWELAHRGVSVEAVVFADGVYHLGGVVAHRLRLAQLMAYLPRLIPWRWPAWCRPAIKLPRNVTGETHWYVQDNFRWLNRMTWLRGHNIVWDDTGEDVPGRVDVRGATHRWMDEHVLFTGRVLEVADRLFGEKAAA